MNRFIRSVSIAAGLLLGFAFPAATYAEDANLTVMVTKAQAIIPKPDKADAPTGRMVARVRIRNTSERAIVVAPDVFEYALEKGDQQFPTVAPADLDVVVASELKPDQEVVLIVDLQVHTVDVQPDEEYTLTVKGKELQATGAAAFQFKATKQ